jgi:3-deoxy-manno-octulosonate cytidylyltransferase (CMP-KDO synthetase)
MMIYMGVVDLPYERIDSMASVAVIPSRYESSRFSGKPLAEICGKPMIQHVYDAAIRSQSIDQAVVATDDKRIYDAVIDFGGQALMTSEKHRSGTDRTLEAARHLKLSGQDIVINVQGDQPLMDPRCLDQVIAPLEQEPDLEMSTLAFPIVDPAEYAGPKDVKVVMNRKGDALYFSRAPIPHDRDGSDKFKSYKHLGIYAYRYHFLEVFSELETGYLEGLEKLEQLRALEYGHTIRVVITQYDSPEVDLPEDIHRIETLLCSK